MKRNRALLTFGTLAVTFGWGAVAKAEDDFALSFALEPKVQADGKAEVADQAAIEAIAPAPPAETMVTEAVETEAVAEDAPLPIPPGAENPPMSGDTTWPAGVYGGVDALALGAVQSVQALLPAPPPAPAGVQVAAAPPQEASSVPAAASAASSTTADPGLQEKMDDILGLTLDLEPRQPPESIPEPERVPAPEPQAQPAIATSSRDAIQAYFEGGTDSLVARAVGSAEGTRTPEGHKNPAYFGHVDPGNGVWNLGTFSYQHGARTPEEADEKQLLRLQRQTAMLKQKAQERGLDLSQEELLNGIDLANQAPLAALDRGGYIDWLKEAHKLGMSGSEAIVWARTRSFIDPDTQRWNAPGLGNNVYSISHDQERRANAIARALKVAPTGLVAQAPPASASPPQLPQPPVAVQPAIKEEFALSLEVPDSFVRPSNGTTVVAQAPAEELVPPTPQTTPEAETPAEGPQASQPETVVLASARGPFANLIAKFWRADQSPAQQPLTAATAVSAAMANRPEVEADEQTDAPTWVEAAASEESVGDQADDAALPVAQTPDPLQDAEEEPGLEEPMTVEPDVESPADQPSEEDPETAAETSIAPAVEASTTAVVFPADAPIAPPVALADRDTKTPLAEIDRIRIEATSPASPDPEAAPAPLHFPSVQPEDEATGGVSPSPKSVDAIADEPEPATAEPTAAAFEGIKKSASAAQQDAKDETEKLIESLNHLQTILRQER